MSDFTLEEARQEMIRLSRLIDAGIDYSKQHAVELAQAENDYRRAKAQAWVTCPTDGEGKRKWTAARREAWVNGECATLRQTRDLAEAMRDAAREAVRARQAQLSAWQTLVRAHQAEAELRPVRLLDLFCGEGGASVGYARAGFDVVGVDSNATRLRTYPYRHVRADALGYLLAYGHEFDVIHASPPCTRYTRATAAIRDRHNRYEGLIAPTREALHRVGVPYVIENVEDARLELRNPVLLCGRMFNLGTLDDDGTPLVLDRHRLFESNLLLSSPTPHHAHDRALQVAGAYSGARRDKVEAREIRRGGYVPASVDVLRDLLGTPWMTEQGCFLSIPPAYTHHLGTQIMGQL